MQGRTHNQIEPLPVLFLGIDSARDKQGVQRERRFGELSLLTITIVQGRESLSGPHGLHPPLLVVVTRGASIRTRRRLPKKLFKKGVEYLGMEGSRSATLGVFGGCTLVTQSMPINGQVPQTRRSDQETQLLLKLVNVRSIKDTTRSFCARGIAWEVEESGRPWP